jgi:hypothetical protein
MKRWITHATIAAYLGALLVGLLSHAVMYLSHSHPLMYLVVWDMYCGWSAFESRYHVLGETYDGRHYQVLPAPWGEFHPYQGPSRRHYDTKVRFLPRMAELVLAHTEHEPVRRLIVVEEAWSKKFNLPDVLWAKQHDAKKDKYSYYHVRAIASRDSDARTWTHEWVTALTNQALMNNPRLMADVNRGHPFYAVDPTLREAPHSGVIPAGYSAPAAAGP